MSCGSISGPTEQHLISVVTANQFAAFTPWMATIGLDVIRAVYNVRALTGTGWDAVNQVDVAFETQLREGLRYL